MSKKILITGGAGFIGYSLIKSIIDNSADSYSKIYCIDNLNAYYDVGLKIDRLESIRSSMRLGVGSNQNNCLFEFEKIDISNKKELFDYLQNKHIDLILHFAAQAGVRYSFEYPDEYMNSNVIGFYNIIESAKFFKIPQVIYASSSSVYGDVVNPSGNTEDLATIYSPVSLYAASKTCNEVIASIYAKLYPISIIGLRFFTVYGPWGRPDMAYFKFLQSILSGSEIEVYNNGNQKRDFTYIDDVISCILSLIDKRELQIHSHEVINVGNSSPVDLIDFIRIIEGIVGKKAKLKMCDAQAGDVKETYANTEKLYDLIGFKPRTQLQEGLSKFIEWYIKYKG